MDTASPSPSLPPRPSAPPRPPVAPDRPGGRPSRRTALVAAAVLAAVVTLTVVLATSGHDRHHSSASTGLPAARGSVDGAAFHGPDADLLVLDGVSGRVQVTADPGATTVTGIFTGADPARHSTVRTDLDAAFGTRALTVRCAVDGGPYAPCAGELRLTVPSHTGLRLRQTSGDTVLTGLGGDLTVVTTSDHLTATGLHSRRASVTVTSGSADVAFTAAPDRLTAQITSASAVLRVPVTGANDGYAVTSSATSANVQVAVPRRDGSPHEVVVQAISASASVVPTTG
ncbi:DUF4097 family beta strand repeat-containing protein [Streptomyces sp. H39-S7]|uniref:DUF4097 family beta strand repeat-containing protein n=1 Tax=Streptomyces sp. H39-S7 TaxID=3004357 RepID=UPI0022AF9409|nr:DUF4097 family beta strand repeat-containing protein [Streptomyces sp. H39-S7]MCZ4119883.1 DUF4097 family beta strand repeat-containing protein [Streptomyces sp. H39-S7]